MEDARRYGTPLPPKIENAPELQVGLELFYVGFMDLTSSRQIGFGEGPISWTTILTYCKEKEIVGEQREAMFYHITHMDSAYLEHRAAKQKREAELNAKTGPTKGKKQ